MSRGPSRPSENVIEHVMDEDCPRCYRPREEHRQITVQVCYSEKVIKHWVCPDAYAGGAEVPAMSATRSTRASRSESSL